MVDVGRTFLNQDERYQVTTIAVGSKHTIGYHAIVCKAEVHAI